MQTMLQLLADLEDRRRIWITQANSPSYIIQQDSRIRARGVADGILFAILAIKEASAIPDATPVVPPLSKLAAALSVKATHINCGYDRTQESAEVRRIMVVIYKELAATIQEALQ